MWTIGACSTTHVVGAALRGRPWRDLPERYGPYSTRYNRWRKKGIWDRLMDAIVEAYDGDIQMINSSSVRVTSTQRAQKDGVIGLAREPAAEAAGCSSALSSERGPNRRASGAGTKAPERGAAMRYFAGLDVSLERTSVCVIDGDGQIVREAKVLSEPDALATFFAELEVDVMRVALLLAGSSAPRSPKNTNSPRRHAPFC